MVAALHPIYKLKAYNMYWIYGVHVCCCSVRICFTLLYWLRNDTVLYWVWIYRIHWKRFWSFIFRIIGNWIIYIIKTNKELWEIRVCIWFGTFTEGKEIETSSSVLPTVNPQNFEHTRYHLIIHTKILFFALFCSLLLLQCLHLSGTSHL